MIDTGRLRGSPASDPIVNVPVGMATSMIPVAAANCATKFASLPSRRAFCCSAGCGDGKGTAAATETLVKEVAAAASLLRA